MSDNGGNNISTPPRQVSCMPQMAAAFSGWMQNITMSVFTQKVVDNGLVEDHWNEICFAGTIQPLSARAIALKPEGQRAWDWFQIHTFSRLEISTNDRISWEGQIYKVMAVKDYGLNNYVEYHIVQDYQP